MSSSAAELLAHEAFVARLARSLSADEAAADDLVQDTWLAALQGRPAEESGLRSWLARVLHNLAVSGLRSRQRRALRERACARPERQPDTGELVERVELQHRLVAAVLALPEAYREVILRHFFRGESVRAMAAALRKPEATVRTRLRRARARLREELRGPSFGETSTAFLAALATLDSTTRWTSDWIMKKTLLQTPLLVGGLLGAGLGFSGSLLIRGESNGAPRDVLEEPRAPGEGRGFVSDASLEPDSVSAAPVRRPAQRELVAASPSALGGTLDGSVSDGALSDDDLRRLLRSADRLDQVRAIRFLLEEGTSAAHGLLLEAFLTTSDAILMAMLEEAILQSDVDVALAVLEAYGTELDPTRRDRLTSMLAQLVARNPALEPAVVELVLGALGDPGPDGARLAGLEGLLQSLGEGALDALALFLADPRSDPAGTQLAVSALRNLDATTDPFVAERVRERIGEIFDALVAATSDPELTDEQRRAVLERTSSLAWAAAGRAPEEHDPLSAVLCGHLFRATDVQQAQTLAWGVASLEGLSQGTRARLSRSILEALPDQRDPDLRQTYLWAVNQLVTQYGNRPLDGEFFEVLRMVEDHVRLAHDPGLSGQLLWLLRELEKHRVNKDG